MDLSLQAERVLLYVVRDCERFGGTGRRVTKIAFALGGDEPESARRWAAAFHELVNADLATLDAVEFGWVYICPTDAGRAYAHEVDDE
jgi:hypothetical protein